MSSLWSGLSAEFFQAKTGNGLDFLTPEDLGFAAVNVALALVALVLAWRVGRYYTTLTAAGAAPSAAA